MTEGRVSVLLVDDSQVFSGYAARFLRTLPGVELAGTALGGLAGLASIQELNPDLVLVDLQMKDFDGFKLIPKIRELVPQIGIIAISLLDENAFRSMTIEVGADDFVDKAYISTALLPAIQKISQRFAT